MASLVSGSQNRLPGRRIPFSAVLGLRRKPRHLLFDRSAVNRTSFCLFVCLFVFLGFFVLFCFVPWKHVLLQLEHCIWTGTRSVVKHMHSVMTGTLPFYVD